MFLCKDILNLRSELVSIFLYIHSRVRDRVEMKSKKGVNVSILAVINIALIIAFRNINTVITRSVSEVLDVSRCKLQMFKVVGIYVVKLIDRGEIFLDR